MTTRFIGIKVDVEGKWSTSTALEILVGPVDPATPVVPAASATNIGVGAWGGEYTALSDQIAGSASSPSANSFKNSENPARLGEETTAEIIFSASSVVLAVGTGAAGAVTSGAEAVCSLSLLSTIAL
ncbi:hypothetical protein Ndes2526B_g00838 [Nannochloris sp. 'desiccata']